MTRLARRLALAVLVLACPSCATYLLRADTWPEPHAYIGMSFDLFMVVDPGEPGPDAFSRTAFFLLDLPLSFVADTRLLPVDLVLYLRRDERPEVCATEDDEG